MNSSRQNDLTTHYHIKKDARIETKTLTRITESESRTRQEVPDQLLDGLGVAIQVPDAVTDLVIGVRRPDVERGAEPVA